MTFEVQAIQVHKATTSTHLAELGRVVGMVVEEDRQKDRQTVAEADTCRPHQVQERTVAEQTLLRKLKKNLQHATHNVLFINITLRNGTYPIRRNPVT